VNSRPSRKARFPLTNQELDRSITLGRVRCWLAGRKQTWTNPAAAVVFIAVYDP
jgi:hypothetical protein